MTTLPNAEILSMIISNAIFNQFGFGPSKSICLPFAEQVLDEQRKVGGIE